MLSADTYSNLKVGLSMSHAPIYFEFPDSRSANLAVDTLTELGYHVHATEIDGRPGLELYVEHNDLTSALEITQATGGTLLDTDGSVSGNAAYEEAYALDTVPIPAHTVNEDWPESYFSDTSRGDTDGTGFANAADGPETFDPSGDDYDHFPAGIKL
ncbi:MAG: hypothetical protein K0Q94_5347 [Paenibacillus sp.]|jgi:hypothetical protein|nr:hypothetical protein [Paenibacillus sp.]